MKAIFKGGWGSLLAFEALVGALVYVVPALLASGENTFFGMLPSGRAFWIVGGWVVAGASAGLAGLTASALGWFPLMRRSRALLLSLLPLACTAVTAGVLALGWNSMVASQAKVDAAWKQILPECNALVPGGLPALVERYWKDDPGVRAITSCLSVLQFDKLLTGGKLDPRDRGALEQILKDGLIPGASFRKQVAREEAFRFLAIDYLRPGNAAEVFRRADEIRFSPVSASDGSGSVSLITCPDALAKLREGGLLREEDLSAIEAAIRRPIDPVLAKYGLPEPARTLALVAAERELRSHR